MTNLNKFKNQMQEIAAIMSEGNSFEEAIENHKQKTFEAYRFMMENNQEVISVLKRLADK